MQVRLVTVLLSLAALASAFSPVANGQDTLSVWKSAPGTVGDWADENNWNAGVPTSATLAAVINGAEVRISGGTAHAQSLLLSHTIDSTVIQSAGRLDIANVLSIANGAYRISGGELHSGSVDLGADFQLIVFVPPDIPMPEIGECGPTDGGICIPPSVLLAVSREFWLEGGAVNVAGAVNLGQALMRIQNGRLDAETLMLDARGWNNSSREALQTGGEVALRGMLKIQDGTYELAGGDLTTNGIGIGDPLGTPAWFGVTRSPEFIQTGGSLHVLSDLEMCVPGFIFQPIEIAPLFSEIVFRLQDGEMQVDGDAIVGSLGAAPARFTQTGGRATIAGTLRIEGEQSRYEISGGALRVGSISVGENVFNEGGILSIGANFAKVTVEEKLSLGEDAVLRVVAPAEITLDGADFQVFGKDAAKLAGLANLGLIVEGNEEESFLEAASQDRGPSSESFMNNFAIGQLIVGRSSAGHLRLLDAVDNGNGDGAPGAVYVDQLVVQAGSTLDLGGLNLYYRRSLIEGEINNSGGAMIALVPEPATLWLAFCAIALGSGWTARRRRSDHRPFDDDPILSR
jgi:hypothetical protein